MLARLPDSSAQPEQRDAYGLTALHHAAKGGDAATIAAILARFPALKDEQDSSYGLTPLMVAVGNTKHAAIAELLKAGANTALTNKKGETAEAMATAAKMFGKLR